MSGMTVFFDDGTFQLDAEVRVATLAYRVDFSGPFVSDTGPFISAPYYFDLSVPDNVKSLFFNADTDVFVALWSKVGNTWRFKCSAQVAMRIYGFADQDISPSSSGLELYSSAGVLTFDAGAKILNVSTIIRAAAAGVVQGWPDTSRRYAAGIGNYPKRGTGAALAGIPYWVQMSYGITVGPSSVGVGEVPISSRPTGGGGTAPPASSPAMQPPNLMVIDVTGY